MALRAAAPTDTLTNGVIPTTATRVRMITYYLDNTVSGHPRLVRRINNGHPTTFNNTLGTAVAIDIENLQFTYDLVDGVNNPSNVRVRRGGLPATGACSPNPCSQVPDSKNQHRAHGTFDATRCARKDRVFRNTLTSQVSLRGMAFVDEYLAP